MSETRERLLHQTELLLAERSYHSFSYADLAKSLDIRKPSIHYHFPKKADLVGAVVEGIIEGFGRWRQAHAAQSPSEQLRAYFELFRGFVRQGHGCPHATLSAELGTLPPALVSSLRTLLDDHVTWLTEILSQGRERGEFSFGGTASATAWLVGAAVQGAVATARSMGSARYDEIVAQQAVLLGLEP